VLGTFTPDMSFPSTACLVQDRIGLVGPAIEVEAACAGFMYALITGAAYVVSGASDLALIVGGDCNSRVVNPNDIKTYPLFGDGAGAVLLQPWATCRQGLIEDFTLGADGEGIPYIVRPRGGGADPISEEIVRAGEHFITMQGRAVYRFAAQRMIWLLDWAMRGQDPTRLGWMIPHQMNRRILEEATRHLGIPAEKVLHNIHKYGNTSSASVPILMSEAYAKGILEKDKFLVLGAFGAGLTWAGARVLW
jgi:3-oxoacyl-[acyl-carrier-protein] synthase-3